MVFIIFQCGAYEAKKRVIGVANTRHGAWAIAVLGTLPARLSLLDLVRKKHKQR
jgi:hypothetical protein